MDTTAEGREEKGRKQSQPGWAGLAGRGGIETGEKAEEEEDHEEEEDKDDDEEEEEDDEDEEEEDDEEEEEEEDEAEEEAEAPVFFSSPPFASDGGVTCSPQIASNFWTLRTEPEPA